MKVSQNTINKLAQEVACLDYENLTDGYCEREFTADGYTLVLELKTDRDTKIAERGNWLQPDDYETKINSVVESMELWDNEDNKLELTDRQTEIILKSFKDEISC